MSKKKNRPNCNWAKNRRREQRKLFLQSVLKIIASNQHARQKILQALAMPTGERKKKRD